MNINLKTIKIKSMKQLELINDDFTGRIEKLRHACRGILIRDGNVLLGYETIGKKYIIPGGGVEEGETLEQCCEREMLEETGLRVRATQNYLEIAEKFDVWNHINHYFVCEFIEDTGVFHLTEQEEKAGAKLAVELEPLTNFFAAEEYHQKYLDKNPGGYCHIPGSYFTLGKE